MLQKKLQQIQARKKEMRGLLDTDGADLKALEVELDTLNKEEQELINKINLANKLEDEAEEIVEKGTYL